MLLTVDFGGTRTKFAWIRKGKIEKTEVIESTESHTWLFEEIAKRSPSSLALALPGSVPLAFEKHFLWQYGSIPRPDSRRVDYSEFLDLLSSYNLPVPKLVVNDLTAGGFSQNIRKETYVFQLSTGIGVRAFRDGKMLVSDKTPILSEIAREKKTGRGRDLKSYYHWLRKEFRKEWQDPSISRMDWHEIKDLSHPDISWSAEAFVRFIIESIENGPLRDPQIVLIGGGSFAIQKTILPQLKRAGCPAQLGENPDISGALGMKNILEYLHKYQGMPIEEIGA